MRVACCVLLVAALGGPARAGDSGQDPYFFSEPADGRSFLAWWHKVDPDEQEWERLSWQAYILLRAGALEQARAAAERMLELDPPVGAVPGNPDAERFLLEIDAYDPTRQAAAAAAARKWLQQHAEMPAEHRASVRATLAMVERETARQEEVRASVWRARFAPAGALLLLLLFGRHVARSTRAG